MADYKQIFKSLSTPLKDLDVDKIMIGGRDKSVPSSMNSFIVVSMPVTIYDKTYGKGYNWSNSFCRFEIFVRKKGGKLNLNKISDLESELKSLFPICDEYITAKNPRSVLDFDDNDGFSVVTIQATLQIFK